MFLPTSSSEGQVSCSNFGNMLLIFSVVFTIVPLFWTQIGYGLKPPPLLASDRTHSQNLDMLRRHFQRTVPLYGPHVCPSSQLNPTMKFISDRHRPS